MMEHDKKLHVIAGAFCATFGLAAALFLDGPVVTWAASACVIAAFGREVCNETGWLGAPRTGFDWADIAYTLAGGAPVCLLGMLL